MVRMSPYSTAPKTHTLHQADNQQIFDFNHNIEM